MAGLGLIAAAGALALLIGRPTVHREVIEYESSFDGTAPLHAVCFYTRPGRGGRPIVVVMHGYTGSYSRMEWTAQRFAKAGFLAVCPNMRGRKAADADSAGTPDSGGREILDILDALTTASARYDWADSGSANIVGYSGGGGNALSAVTKLPETFRYAVSYFGISDYAAWFDHAVEYRSRIAAWVDGTPATTPERYAARSSAAAAGNALATRVLLFWDSEEKVCQPEMNREFIRVAKEAGAPTVVGHESLPTDEYRWVHGRPKDNQQLLESERLYLPDMLAGGPAPRLPDEGTLTVAGYVACSDFRLFAGNWDDATGVLEYKRGPDGMSFSWSVTTPDKTVASRLEARPPAGKSVTVVTVNGSPRSTERVGEWVRIERLADGDTVEVAFTTVAVGSAE